MVTEKVSEFGKELTTISPCKFVYIAGTLLVVKLFLFTAVSFQVSGGDKVSCGIIGDPILSSSYLLTNHDVSISI